MRSEGPEGGVRLQPIRETTRIETLNALLSVAKHELIISNFRYPLRIVSRFLGPLVWVAPFLIFGRALLGGADSQTLESLTGISHMPTFVIVGTIVTTISFTMLWLMSFAIRLESYRGTFESIYACPVSKFLFFMGKLMASSIWASFYITGLLLLGVLVLDIQFIWVRFPEMILVIIMLFFAMFGFGLVLAGTILVYKESHTLLHFVDGLFSLIVPMAYPLAVLPGALQALSRVLPTTQAVIASRSLVIRGESLLQQTEALVVLLAYIFIIIPVGYRFYRHMECVAKRKGVLHKY
jgi:ABC-2 type transport system permease protein